MAYSNELPYEYMQALRTKSDEATSWQPFVRLTHDYLCSMVTVKENISVTPVQISAQTKFLLPSKTKFLLQSNFRSHVGILADEKMAAHACENQACAFVSHFSVKKQCLLYEKDMQ